MTRWAILPGDVRYRLAEIEAESVHTCVTSPPYWQLRDYGHEEQLGLEATPDEFVAHLVEVMRGVWRALRPDGTLWLNLGDTYLGGRCGGLGVSGLTSERNQDASRKVRAALGGKAHRTVPGLKRKNLVGIPWRVALALQADGWILRSDIIWHKPSAMPSSVRDRPTTDHEYLFLLAKSPRYYFDAGAIREPAIDPEYAIATGSRSSDGLRNRRTVWRVAQEPTSSEHTSTFPRALVRPCILAGAPVDGLVLDPFAGTGTTGVEALALARRFVGIELVSHIEASANLERAAARGGQPPLLEASA